LFPEPRSGSRGYGLDLQHHSPAGHHPDLKNHPKRKNKDGLREPRVSQALTQDWNGLHAYHTPYSVG